MKWIISVKMIQLMMLLRNSGELIFYYQKTIKVLFSLTYKTRRLFYWLATDTMSLYRTHAGILMLSPSGIKQIAHFFNRH